MKKFKQIVSLLTAVAICVLLPGFNTMTVSAEEPTTYCLRYGAGDRDEWRWQVGSAWDDKADHRAVYYLGQEIKDGDIVIVDSPSSTKPLELSVRLSNLTILHGTDAVVHTNGIDECYVLRDSSSAINGDIKNAYVYDTARCTFNDNVGNLQISYSDDQRSTVTVGGTVEHLTGIKAGNTTYEYYSFAKGTLDIQNAKVKTKDTNYSTTAPAASTQPAPQAPAQNSQPSNSSEEYDDVPKTGESNLIFYLLGICTLCLAGRKYVKKAL